ncbi:CRIB domain-containing protein RIC1 [Lolium perenne]|uniref:CRIB domain-containing protein RIC1 n=1 Tax=Lolium perenne TaxID=4522 RepID=UPI0021F667A4|nr:CRIB domain-containing protein RIC10-like [Lolium perenne]
MAVKMKGIFKGLRIISQMFAHKEHEMEIGFPTDVKHVAHIGLGTSDTSPSWMNEFKSIEDMSAGSLSTAGQSRQTSWTSTDFEPARSMLPTDINFPDKQDQESSSCPPRGPRKARRKKPRESSPNSARSSSSRSRTSFATAYDDFNESHRGFRVV